MSRAAIRLFALVGTPVLAVAACTGAVSAGTSPLPSPLGVPPDGLAPTEIAAGDLNGDDVDDLAVANEGGNTITVLLSNAAGGYRPPVRYTVGISPSNVHMFDFTGDGLTDIVDVDAVSNTVSVLPNAGNGALDPAISSPTNTTGSAALTADDFNGDGPLDVAVTNPGGAVAVNFGRGDGSFEAPTTYPGPSGAIGVTSADFNNDGHPDIASVGAASATQSTLINNGDGTFSHSTAAVGVGAVCNRTADLNEDGNVDLVSASARGHVGVLHGRGDGSFGAVQDYPTGSLYGSCFGVGDLNGDKHEDLAVANIAGASMSVLLGRGDGALGPPTEHPTNDATITCTVSDINEDSALDVVCPGGAVPVVVAFDGRGDGTFGPARKIALA